MRFGNCQLRITNRKLAFSLQERPVRFIIAKIQSCPADSIAASLILFAPNEPRNQLGGRSVYNAFKTHLVSKYVAKAMVTEAQWVYFHFACVMRSRVLRNLIIKLKKHNGAREMVCKYLHAFIDEMQSNYLREPRGSPLSICIRLSRELDSSKFLSIANKFTHFVLLQIFLEIIMIPWNYLSETNV